MGSDPKWGISEQLGDRMSVDRDTGIVFRPPEEEEWSEYCNIVQPTWGRRVIDQDRNDLRELVELERCLGAWDHGHLVGTCHALTLSLSVPDGDLPLAGLSFGQVVPSHRRRGILRQLVSRLHRQAVERGEPLVGGWPAKAGVHTGFGWGAATRSAWLNLDVRDVSFRESTYKEVEVVETGQAVSEAREVYSRAREQRGGMPERSEIRWRQWPTQDPWHWRGGEWLSDLGPRLCVVVEGHGYAAYRMQERWGAGGASSRLLLSELVAITPEGHRALWEYLCNLDLISSITAVNIPYEDPLPLIVRDMRAASPSVVDGLWLCLLDVVGCLEGRRYWGTGSCVVEVLDALDGPAGGRYELTLESGGCSCRRTKRLPDVVMPVSSLSAAYLGGTRFTDLQRAGALDCADVEKLLWLDTAFRSDPHPWCPWVF